VLAGIPEEAQRRLAEQLTQWKLPAEFAEEIHHHHVFVTYGRGEHLFLQGSTPNVGFWILSGLVKLYYANSNGGRVVIALLGPGDLTGFSDRLESNGRRVQAFGAEALAKTSVALFTRDHVVKALQTLSAGKLASALEQFNTNWSSLACSCARFLGMSFRERLRTVLSNLAARSSVKDSRGIVLTEEISHSDLAEMIVSSRQMVSRMMGELMVQRVIAREGRHYILLNKAGATDVAEPTTKGSASLSNGART
jgi:CRP-like cAMP-binding protein